MEKFKASQSPLTLKALEYETKVHSIEDCMIAIKNNENISVGDGLKIVRKLANKQFKSMVKKEKLVRFAQMNRPNNDGAAGAGMRY